MNNNLELGRVVVTHGIYERIKKDKKFLTFVQICLGRYANCDWGDTTNDDKHLNDQALKDGERILAVYNYPLTNETIWIITEWDRSATTVLFPDEY